MARPVAEPGTHALARSARAMVLTASCLVGTSVSVRAAHAERLAIQPDPIEARMTDVLKTTGRLRLPELRFAPKSDTLLKSAEPTVRRLAHVLASLSGTYLVAAHVGATRDVTFDQSLTDRRAAVVRTQLIRHGVPAAHLMAMGYGGTKPI